MLTAEANIVAAPFSIEEDLNVVGLDASLLLDGTGDAVNLAAAESALDTMTNNYTIEAWFRVEEGATGVQTIASKGDSWTIEVNADNGDVSFIQAPLAPVVVDTLTANTDVADGDWHHVAAVVQTFTLGAVMSLYVDGVLEEALGGIIPAGSNNTTALIGSNSANPAADFEGGIDEVRFWNVARSGPQINGSRNAPLDGNEGGLVAYYSFQEGDATDGTGSGGNGVLVGDATVQEQAVVGEVVVQLSEAVTAEPGIILEYEIGLASTATEGVDFYASQLDLSTVSDLIPVTNSVFIPQGQSSAVISIAALADAVDEPFETIVINLLPDQDPFNTGSPVNYTVGVNNTATIRLLDSESYDVGIATVNAFGEDAVVENLELDADGQATLAVSLTSQPESSVQINLSNGTSGNLSHAQLTFGPADWDQPQVVTLSGLSGNDDGIEDVLGSVTLSVAPGSDAGYLGQGKSITVHDESDNVKVRVDEGGSVQPVTPTVTVVNIADTIEGNSETGVLLFTSDVAAPAGGLMVSYELADNSLLGTEYNLIGDEDVGDDVRLVVIPEGQLSAAVLVNPIDDEIASGDTLVTANLRLDAGYQLGVNSSASVLVEEDDSARIITSVLTNIGALDLSADTDDLFDIVVDSFTANATGAAVTLSVSLTQAPTDAVSLTIADSNSANNGVLAFGVGQQGPQSVTLDLLSDANGQLGLSVSTGASSDMDYSSLGLSVPLLQAERPFDVTSFLTTSEAGDDFRFGVRLDSQPTAPVTVTLSSVDPSEGQISETLVFTASNWDQHQIVTVLGQDDALLDDDRPYTITVGAASADLNYSGLSADFGITNQDNETRVEEGIDTTNTSPIIVTFSSLTTVGFEGGAQPQFDLLLSEPAPVGGLLVEYVVLEQSATGKDLGLPRFVDRSGDRNPLSLAQVEDPLDITADAKSLTFGDLDNDGDQDGLLSFDNGQTQLFLNEGTNQLPDFSVDNTVNPLLATMGFGSGIGDVNGDGDLDIIQVNAAQNGVRYFENQLVESGAFAFVEQVGAANPFDSLVISNPATPSLVDLDNDGVVELVLTKSNSGATEYYERSGMSYQAAAFNPLASFTTFTESSLTFGDVDDDGDLDAYLGGFEQLRFLENVGTPTDPVFFERTGDDNPANSVDTEFTAQYPALVDIDNDNDLDLFTGSVISIGEVGTTFRIRYLESPETQEVLVPEGVTSLTVTVPVVDDLIDEAIEDFEVALVAQPTQTFDFVATADFVNETQLEVTQLVDSNTLGLTPVFGALDNIIDFELQAGTVLDFGSWQATVTQDTFFFQTTIDVEVPVAITGTANLGDIASAELDQTVTLRVAPDGDLFNGEIGLEIPGDETALAVLLEAGTQLTFSGGTTVEVGLTTLVQAFETTFVPVSVIGAGSVGFSETVDVAAKIGELELLVDEPGVDFYALTAGTVLSLSDGSSFVVVEPEVIPAAVQGDYNANGVVDAADYTVWRDNLGSTVDLAADGNGNGVVDQADYAVWVENFGSTAPGSGAAVTGYVVGSDTTQGATATITESGYRTAANLEVTGAFDGSTVDLRIDETAFGSFTIPAGTLLEFDGGAVVTVDSPAVVNNVSGASVPVTLTGLSAEGTILVGDSSATADFFSLTTVITTEPGVDDGFIFLNIVEPGVDTLEILAGTQLVFASGAVVQVASTVTIDEIANPTGTEVEAFIVAPSTVPGVEDIMANDTATAGGFLSVGSIEIDIEDNDEAGVLMVPSGMDTTEAGSTRTIDVSLTTVPTEDVILVLGVDGDVARLSDSDQTNEEVIQLTFTPLNWDTVQTVTVTGVDDDVDDGDVNYAIRTTVISGDLEYSDDAVEIFIENVLGAPPVALVTIADIGIADAGVPEDTVISFANGAVIQLALNGDALIQNDEPTDLSYTFLASADKVPVGETVTAVEFLLNRDDFSTILDVTSAYDAMTGEVGLQIEANEQDVMAATLLAGYVLTFSNGTVAVLDQNVTVTKGAPVQASVTLQEGSDVPMSATTAFGEVLSVTTAYNSSTGDIGLRVADSLVSSVTFDANTQLETSNGVYLFLTSQTVFSNASETVAAVTAAVNDISPQATGFYTERLVDNLIFTNVDDDTAGITVRQTDPTLAVTEGASNNYFTVVLDSEPTAEVFITLTPSDDNIRLESEFMGEPLTISFDATNWDAPQTVEVSAVDDALLEYDHLSTIAVSVTTADAVYAGVPLPNDLEVFIEDDELPSASVVVVAGAIEANSPGYFAIELDTPAPFGPDENGIVVSYSIGGTINPVTSPNNTADVQPITGTARIAPGETRSAVIAFPIDDFLAEGAELQVTSGYDSGSDSTISLQLNVAPFQIGPGVYNAGNETIELRLDNSVTVPNETTILSQGTTLLLGGTTTAVVTDTVIVGRTNTVVPVTLMGSAMDVVNGALTYQQVPLPEDTTLEFPGGAVIMVDSNTTVSNETATAVNVTLTEGASLVAAANDVTNLPGESVVVTITTDAASEYQAGDASSAALTILDNDKPGIRVAEAGDTTAIEGESGTGYALSLLSQPLDTVTVTLTAPMTTAEIVVDQAYAGSADTVGLRVNSTEIVSLMLPAGAYDFGGVTVTLAGDTTLSSDTFTDASVSLSGALGASSTADYSYNEVLFDNGTDTEVLTFTGSDWFLLQDVNLVAVDDNVVEAGDSHSLDLTYSVASLDPNYNLFEQADQTITLIDRRFDVVDTYQSLAEGFLALEESLDSVSLPILGDFGEVAPPIFDKFLEDLVVEVRNTDNLTTETLGDAFENAINAQFEGDSFLQFTVSEVSTDELAFVLSFGDTLMTQVPLNSDFGLEALALNVESEGTIDLAVDYGLSLGFGISKSDGFFLSVEDTAFEVAASVALSEDFSATGSLGFLQLDIANAVNFVGATVDSDFDLAEELPLQLIIDSTPFEPILLEADQVIVLDSGVEITVAEETEISGPGLVEIPVSAATDVVAMGDTIVLGDVDGTMLDAAFTVTLVDANDTSGDDTRLTLNEIAAARGSADPFSFLSYGFSGDAALDLDVSTSVSGSAAFPSFSFNLASSLPLFNYANEDEAGSDETPTLTVDTGFSNVAENATAMLALTATGVANDVRLAKGTELVFAGVRVAVDKSVTLAPDVSGMVRVKVLDDKDMVAETFSVAMGSSATLASSGFDIAFNDITLDLGEFITDLLSPIIVGVNDIVEPFEPVIDVLTSELKFLESIGLAGAFDQDGDGVATLVEVALSLSGGFTNQNTAEKFSKFVNAVTGVIELTTTLSDLEESLQSETLALNFGSYVLEDFKGGSEMADAAAVDVDSEGTATDPDTAPDSQTMATGQSRVSSFFSALDDLGISLDVVENPLNVIKLFLGQDIDLVTWDVPELDLSFTIDRSFPVFAGISGVLQGGFSVYSDLVFGFDTFGFSQWKESDFAIEDAYLVFDGFYVSDIDPETGEDIPELTLDATIAAGAELNVVIASVTAVGGITGSAALDLIDVGEYQGESDGRLRGSEILANIKRPANLLQITGAVEAFLNIAVKIGLNLGFFKIQKTVVEIELARVTLFEFTVGGGGGGGASTASSTLVGAGLEATADEPIEYVENTGSEAPVEIAYATASEGVSEPLVSEGLDSGFSTAPLMSAMVAPEASIPRTETALASMATPLDTSYAREDAASSPGKPLRTGAALFALRGYEPQRVRFDRERVFADLDKGDLLDQEALLWSLDESHLDGAPSLDLDEVELNEGDAERDSAYEALASEADGDWVKVAL